MTEPYRRCLRCGACCREMLIEIGAHDLLREPRLRPVVTPVTREHRDAGDRFWHGYLLADGANGKPCPMLDGDTCTIYASRPDVCVGHAPSPITCRAPREKAQEKGELAGAGWPEPDVGACPAEVIALYREMGRCIDEQRRERDNAE